MTRDSFLKHRSQRFNYLFMRHPLTICSGYIFVFFARDVPLSRSSDKPESTRCLVAFVVHWRSGDDYLYILAGWLLITLVISIFIADAIGTYLLLCPAQLSSVSFNDKAGWTYDKARWNPPAYENRSVGPGLRRILVTITSIT